VGPFPTSRLPAANKVVQQGEYATPRNPSHERNRPSLILFWRANFVSRVGCSRAWLERIDGEQEIVAGILACFLIFSTTTGPHARLRIRVCSSSLTRKQGVWFSSADPRPDGTAHLFFPAAVDYGLRREPLGDTGEEQAARIPRRQARSTKQWLQ